MERFTISLDEPLAQAFDAFVRARGYASRSEAIRDLVRETLDRQALASGEATHCVAALSYIYDHHERELAERLTVRQHEHHDLCVATMHAHLDHRDCLETVLLRGATGSVRAFADATVAERGVRHGALNLVPARIESGTHGHGDAVAAAHVHARPRT
ncbi:MAG: nickel-responsive transcriptional regulator NikR [Burkholderiales bacterium]